MPDLQDLYRHYLACCNERRFADIAEYVHDEIRFNGQPTSLEDYVASIASNIEAVPDYLDDRGHRHDRRPDRGSPDRHR